MYNAMRHVSANGLSLPAVGQGGWNIGDDPSKEADEISALRRGISLGLSLIDTAEMYGGGRSEMLIGKAAQGINRDEIILVSKVLPHNADRSGIFRSCQDSLSRLGTDYIDLYLLHWRGNVPLSETVECMEELVSSGRIRRWGVSNFDVSDMEELFSVPGGTNCAVDQVLYNISSRGIEYDLLPWLSEHKIAAMAYCPLAQAGTLKRMNKDILKDGTLLSAAEKYKISIFQLLLAFTLRNPGVISVPKSGSAEHTEENAAAAAIEISDNDWEQIDKVFWPPSSKMHLDME